MLKPDSFYPQITAQCLFTVRIPLSFAVRQRRNILCSIDVFIKKTKRFKKSKKVKKIENQEIIAIFLEEGSL